MDANQVRFDLMKRCAQHGLRKVSGELGLDPSYVSRVCNGHQLPGPAILRALGYELVTEYRRTNHKGKGR